MTRKEFEAWLDAALRDSSQWEVESQGLILGKSSVKLTHARTGINLDYREGYYGTLVRAADGSIISSRTWQPIQELVQNLADRDRRAEGLVCAEREKRQRVEQFLSTFSG